MMDSKAFIYYCGFMKNQRYAEVSKNLVYQLPVAGRGDYGTCFHLSDGKIGKIFKSHDEAYKSFLNMVMVVDNPHLPQVLLYGENKHFGWVILEFLDEYSLSQYFNLTFSDITSQMSCIIREKDTDPRLVLPSSLKELAEEMRSSAEGFCLDFRRVNFGVRQGTLVAFDPYTKKTPNNNHLDYVEIKRKEAA